MTTCTDCRDSACKGTPVYHLGRRIGLRIECLRCGTARHLLTVPRPSLIARLWRWVMAPLTR